MYIYLHRHVFQIEFLVGKKLKRQRKFLKCCVLNACCMHSNKVYTTYNCTIYDNQPILLKRELLNAGLFYIQHLYKYVCAFDKKMHFNFGKLNVKSYSWTFYQQARHLMDATLQYVTGYATCVHQKEIAVFRSPIERFHYMKRSHHATSSPPTYVYAAFRGLTTEMMQEEKHLIIAR